MKLWHLEMSQMSLFEINGTTPRLPFFHSQWLYCICVCVYVSMYRNYTRRKCLKKNSLSFFLSPPPPPTHSFLSSLFPCQIEGAAPSKKICVHVGARRIRLPRVSSLFRKWAPFVQGSFAKEPWEFRALLPTNRRHIMTACLDPYWGFEVEKGPKKEELNKHLVCTKRCVEKVEWNSLYHKVIGSSVPAGSKNLQMFFSETTWHFW